MRSIQTDEKPDSYVLCISKTIDVRNLKHVAKVWHISHLKPYRKDRNFHSSNGKKYRIFSHLCNEKDVFTWFKKLKYIKVYM